MSRPREGFAAEYQFWFAVFSILPASASAISLIQKWFSVGLVPVLADLLAYYRAITRLLLAPLQWLLPFQLPDWYRDGFVLSALMAGIAVRSFLLPDLRLRMVHSKGLDWTFYGYVAGIAAVTTVLLLGPILFLVALIVGGIVSEGRIGSLSRDIVERDRLNQQLEELRVAAGIHVPPEKEIIWRVSHAAYHPRYKDILARIRDLDEGLEERYGFLIILQSVVAVIAVIAVFFACNAYL